MKDKKPLAIGARCRVKDIEQLEGTLVSDTGIVVEESDAAVKVHHDHWPKDEWYLREQCRRLRKKPRPAKEEREPPRVERCIVELLDGSFDGFAFHDRFHVSECYDNNPTVKSIRHLVEMREGDVIINREKLEKALKGISIDSLTGIELCESLGLPAKEPQ